MQLCFHTFQLSALVVRDEEEDHVFISFQLLCAVLGVNGFQISWHQIEETVLSWYKRQCWSRQWIWSVASTTGVEFIALSVSDKSNKRQTVEEFYNISKSFLLGGLKDLKNQMPTSTLQLAKQETQAKPTIFCWGCNVAKACLTYFHRPRCVWCHIFQPLFSDSQVVSFVSAHTCCENSQSAMGVVSSATEALKIQLVWELLHVRLISRFIPQAGKPSSLGVSRPTPCVLFLPSASCSGHLWPAR